MAWLAITEGPPGLHGVSASSYTMDRIAKLGKDDVLLFTVGLKLLNTKWILEPTQ